MVHVSKSHTFTTPPADLLPPAIRAEVDAVRQAAAALDDARARHRKAVAAQRSEADKWNAAVKQGNDLPRQDRRPALQLEAETMAQLVEQRWRDARLAWIALNRAAEQPDPSVLDIGTDAAHDADQRIREAIAAIRQAREDRAAALAVRSWISNPVVPRRKSYGQHGTYPLADYAPRPVGDSGQLTIPGTRRTIDLADALAALEQDATHIERTLAADEQALERARVNADNARRTQEEAEARSRSIEASNVVLRASH